MHICYRKRAGMLQAISWKEYIILIVLGLVFYYGWWLVRYYPGLSKSRAGTGGLKGDPLVEETKDMVKRDVRQEAAVAIEEDTGSKQLELPLPVVIDRPVFLPEVAGRLMEELRGIFGKAKEERIVEGDLIYMLQRVLRKEVNKQLRGTAYEEKINALMARELERYGSVRPDAEVLKGFWCG